MRIVLTGYDERQNIFRCLCEGMERTIDPFVCCLAKQEEAPFLVGYAVEIGELKSFSGGCLWPEKFEVLQRQVATPAQADAKEGNPS